MKLYLMRHGIPIEPQNWHDADRTRPLTPLGHAQVSRVAEGLHEELQGALIWSSPYVRAEQTAKEMARICESEVIIRNELKSGQNLLRSLTAGILSAHFGESDILVCVGHQPDLGLLVSDLLGPEELGVAFGRATVACLEGEFASSAMRLLWSREAP